MQITDEMVDAAERAIKKARLDFLATGRDRASQAWFADAARAALTDALAQANEWQPIETAPRNGESILLWSEMWEDTIGVSIGTWDQFAVEAGALKAWVGSNFDTSQWGPDEQPTHWCPLPAPPTI